MRFRVSSYLAEQGHAGDGLQLTLRFSFPPRLMPGVRRQKENVGIADSCYLLGAIVLYRVKHREQSVASAYRASTAPLVMVHTMENIVAETTWDTLLDLVRQWIILRFALNTEHDLWGWLFLIGASAHLEYLAIAVLWVADQKPTPFEQYQPKRTHGLGQIAGQIRKRDLLDLTTVDTLERVAKLRTRWYTGERPTVFPFVKVIRREASTRDGMYLPILRA